MFNKRKLRILIDSFYYRKTNNLKKLGNNEIWNIDVTNLSDKSIVYSGGVGKDISFEIDLVNKFNCRIFLYDPTPIALSTIERRSPLNPRISYFSIGLNGEDGIVRFSEPENLEEGSFSVYRKDKKLKSYEYECRSISSLMRENNHIEIDLLKIDIEGFEYSVMDDILKNKLIIKQICVEFHDHLHDSFRKRKQDIIKKLKDRGYVLIFKDMNDHTFLMKK